MEVWFILLISLCFCLFTRALLTLLSSTPSLPPGPLRVPIIGTLLWLRRSFSELNPVLRNLHSKCGPIFTLPIGFHSAIFIADGSLAHLALIQNGAVFSDRPKALATSKIINSHQHNISSTCYGPTWRFIRRNLTSQILHPARIKSFSGTRKRVLEVLVHRLKSDSESNNSIKVIDHLLYAMFCLLVFMCFGDKVDEKQIKCIEHVQRRLLLNFGRFTMLNFCPKISRILFRKRWEEFLQLRKEQSAVMVPLIKARKKSKEEKKPDEFIVPYVDTLLDLEWPEEKRKLDEHEIVNLCSEFLTAGTDTTASALQWIMANLVKYPHIQQRLVDEIRSIVCDREEKELKEEDFEKLPYLKAVILEGLRRHPPGRLLLPHAVTKDVVLNGYLVPKNSSVNFMVAEMGLDPKAWENPMEFKPERFLNSEENGCEAFDIAGSKEIKMMPFGAGRRICPAYNLAMLHLEYFVANLVWKFWWKASNGGDVDLSEKQEFTTVMKNPLQVYISPRF